MTQTHSPEIYTRDTFVHVLPFTRQHEGDEVIIGRVETGVFIAVPSGAVEILDHLASGKSVGETADLYRDAYGQAPDLDDFLVALQAKGFIDPTSGAEQAAFEESAPAYNDAPRKSPAPKRYHFGNFPQSLARRIFSWPMIALSALLIAFAVLLMARDHSLWPNRDTLYISDHRAIILSVLAVVSYISIILHELAHLIAARAVGVKSRIGFSRRMYDFVIETDLTGLWAVPKRQRYLPFLAGCLFDATIASFMVFLLCAHKKGWIAFSATSERIWLTLLLTYIARIFWECLVFVRTDYYYVLAIWLNCRNLLGDTEAFLKNQVARLLPWIGAVDQSAIPRRERKILPYFAVVWIVGRFVALYWLGVFILPLLYRYLADFAHSTAKYTINPAGFWQALGMVCIVIGPPILGLVMWVRSLQAPLWFLTRKDVQHG